MKVESKKLELVKNKHQPGFIPPLDRLGNEGEAVRTNLASRNTSSVPRNKSLPINQDKLLLASLWQPKSNGVVQDRLKRPYKKRETELETKIKKGASPVRSRSPVKVTRVRDNTEPARDISQVIKDHQEESATRDH